MHKIFFLIYIIFFSACQTEKINKGTISSLKKTTIPNCLNVDFEKMNEIYFKALDYRYKYKNGLTRNKENQDSLIINLEEMNKLGIYNISFGNYEYKDLCTNDDNHLGFTNGRMLGSTLVGIEDTVIQNLRFCYVLVDAVFNKRKETRFGIIIFPDFYEEYIHSYDCRRECDLSISLYFPLSECLCEWDKQKEEGRISAIIRSGFSLSGENNENFMECFLN
jgi:hypothetical protein